MSFFAKVALALAFVFACLWTVALFAIARRRRTPAPRPRPCAHQWQTVERYHTGHEKSRCRRCGAARLLVPPYRRTWF